MYWKSLVSDLCCSTDTTIISGFENEEYEQLMLISPIHTPLYFSDHVLYFCTVSKFLHLKDDLSNFSFVLYKDQDLPSLDTLQVKNLLVFDLEDAFYRFYEKISKDIFRLQQLEKSISSLYDLISENISLQELINRIDSLFQATVSLLDNTFCPMAYSDCTPVMSDTIQKDIQSKTLPLHWARYLFDAERSVSHSISSFDQNLSDGYHLRNYFTSIYMNRVKLASFSLLFIRPEKDPLPALSDELLDLMQKTAAVLSVKLSNSVFLPDSETSYYSYLFSSFFNNIEDRPVSELEDRLFLFGYRAQKIKYLLLLDSASSSMSLRERKLLASQIQGILSGSVEFVYKKDIIFIASYKENHNLLDEELLLVKELLRSTEAKLSISSAFESFSALPLALNEAKSAIDADAFASKGDFILKYDDLRFDDIARICKADPNWKKLCYPPFLRLLNYDEAHHSNLVETLFLYFDKKKKSSDICSCLHIHKNTLYYRLNLIKEIMTEDFENPEHLSQIYFTAKLLGIK